jgi:hypothetical protein
VLAASSVACAAVKVVDQRYAYEHNGKTYKLPYKSNYAMDMKNSDIKHVIIPIHSGEYDVEKLFDNYKKLISKYEHAKFSTFIMAPQFNRKKYAPNVKENDMLLWGPAAFGGSSTSYVLASDECQLISSYAVVEEIITKFCNKEIFPNLERITIAGHSSGGNFVQKFAVGNTVGESGAAEAGVNIRYIAMSPSLYMYLSDKRSVGGSKREFAVPNAEQIKKAPKYNTYGYGLRFLFRFFSAKGLDAQKIRAIYPERNIIYIVGQGTTERGRYFYSTPEAMLQGANRYERAKMFFGHLVDEYGAKKIMKTQKLVTISGVENSLDEVMFSTKGAKYILGK